MMCQIFMYILALMLFFCDTFEATHSCPGYARYRTIDGSCNNLIHSTWGQADTPQRRFIDWEGNPMVAYEDGYDTPRGYPDKLPSPRLISNVLSSESLGYGDQFDSIRTGQNMAFGQLVAHDFIETKIDSGIDCCDSSEPESQDLDICFPFDVPENDNSFPSGCKSFMRASKATGANVPDYREQINLITTYIDASFTYGSTQEQSDKVREPDSFLMKTDPGELLPTTDGGSCLKLVPSDRCPFTGDNRNSVAPNLELNHMAFVREHNRIANELHVINPHWNNETVFQETRRIVIAMVQHITYNQFLPTIVDRRTMGKFSLFSKESGFANIYNSSVDASIRNGFAIAPYRYGHSQIMAEESLLYEDLTTVVVNKVEDHLQSPHLLQINEGANVPGLARWLSFKPAMKIDNLVVDAIHDNMFFLKSPPGKDLFSLNIQRGRDQGVPGYNKWREFCGLKKVKSFSEFGRSRWQLASVYNHVDDIDFFIGGLFERGSKGSVGPTFACVIGKQFELFKTGDRYWYESNDPDFAFTKEQLSSIKEGSSLSKVFCRNFNLRKITLDILIMPHKYNNPITCCDILPDIDLSLWKDDIDD